jgi:hypothetical protein
VAIVVTPFRAWFLNKDHTVAAATASTSQGLEAARLSAPRPSTQPRPAQKRYS